MRGAAFTLSPRLPRLRVNFARAGNGTALTAVVERRFAAADAHRPRSASSSIADSLEALRAIARFAGEDGATLELAPLNQTSAAAGYAARRTRPTGNAPGSGLTVEAEGVAPIVRGDALLRVAATPQRRGPFALIDDPGAQPKLPDETPGWEERSYALTLCGRDAFNSMTDRRMRFRHTFGARGYKVLEAFGEAPPSRSWRSRTGSSSASCSGGSSSGLRRGWCGGGGFPRGELNCLHRACVSDHAEPADPIALH